MRIANKVEFFVLSQKLQLGNRLRQWTFREFIQLSWKQLPERISVRSRNRTASVNIQRYRMTSEETFAHLRSLRSNGVSEEDFFLDESAPDDLLLIQGEVMQDQRYLYLRYNTVPGLGMRQAYPTMKHAYGLEAVTLLKSRMDADSWDCLNQLLGDYPDHVVELSVYKIPVGVLRWNTITWECREDSLAYEFNR